MVHARSLILVALSTGSLALYAAAQICSRFTFESGVDYVGQDIANVKSASASDCCSYCTDQLACNAFTWTDYAGGTCWLKSSRGDTQPSNGTISAFDPKANVGTTCPNLQRDVTYDGAELAFLRNVENPGACCIQCAKTTECVAFSFSDYAGYCSLQKTGASLTSRQGWESGKRTVGPTCPPIQTGVAYSGKTLAIVQGVQNSGECCAKCQQTKQCAVFSWHYTSATTDCYLHKAGATLVVLSGVSSGVPTGPCGPIEENVDYGGADIGNARGSKAEDCCSVCRANKKCKAFSWSSYGGGTCWLKADKGTPTARSGVRSGVVAAPRA